MLVSLSLSFSHCLSASYAGADGNGRISLSYRLGDKLWCRQLAINKWARQSSQQNRSSRSSVYFVSVWLCRCWYSAVLAWRSKRKCSVNSFTDDNTSPLPDLMTLCRIIVVCIKCLRLTGLVAHPIGMRLSERTRAGVDQCTMLFHKMTFSWDKSTLRTRFKEAQTQSSYESRNIGSSVSSERRFWNILPWRFVSFFECARIHLLSKCRAIFSLDRCGCQNLLRKLVRNALNVARRTFTVLLHYFCYLIEFCTSCTLLH